MSNEQQETQTPQTVADTLYPETKQPEQVEAVDGANTTEVTTPSEPDEKPKETEGKDTSLVNGDQPAPKAGDDAEDKKTTDTQEVELKPSDIKLPEGVEVNEDALKNFIDILNNKELTGVERAEKLVGLQSELANQARQATLDNWAAQNEEWKTQVKNDPEIGGSKLSDNVNKIAGVIDAYGSPELRQAFDFTGIGNHPEFMKFMVNIAGELSESSFASPNMQGASQIQTIEDVADAMYPLTNK